MGIWENITALNTIYRQQGSILVVAMMVLLVMALMGAALVQTTMQSSRTAQVKAVDTEVFHLTESCNHEIIDWLGLQTRPPDDTNLPYSVERENLAHLFTGDETEAMIAKLQEYSYSCSVTAIASQSVSADDENEGKDIGMVEGYGTAGDISPRYYYDIDATGNGPMGGNKRITTIVSLEF